MGANDFNRNEWIIGNSKQIIYKGKNSSDKNTPNPAIIESIMNTLEDGYHDLNNKKKNSYSYPIRQIFIGKNPHNFVLPSEMEFDINSIKDVNEDSIKTVENIKLYWKYVTNNILKGLFDTVINNFNRPEFLTKVKTTSEIKILETDVNYNTFYFNVDIEDKNTTSETINKTLDIMRNIFRKTLTDLMTGTNIIDESCKIGIKDVDLANNVGIKNKLTHILNLRENIETSEEKKKYLGYIEGVCKTIGFKYDIEKNLLKFDFLSAEDYYLYGNLSTCSTKNGITTISVPITYYGTDSFIPLSKLNEILAHELAHYEIRKGAKKEDKHGYDHEKISHKLRELLDKALEYEVILKDIVLHYDNDKNSSSFIVKKGEYIKKTETETGVFQIETQKGSKGYWFYSKTK